MRDSRVSLVGSSSSGGEEGLQVAVAENVDHKTGALSFDFLPRKLQRSGMDSCSREKKKSAASEEGLSPEIAAGEIIFLLSTVEFSFA